MVNLECLIQPVGFRSGIVLGFHPSLPEFESRCRQPTCLGLGDLTVSKPTDSRGGQAAKHSHDYVLLDI